MIFRTGQRVACVVDDHAWDFWIALVRLRHGVEVPRPEKGAVYTIDFVDDDGFGVFLHFVELKTRAGYGAEGFRPLVEIELDVSEFHAILDRVNAGEREPAPGRVLETAS
jgi:hypothetical protein